MSSEKLATLIDFFEKNIAEMETKLRQLEFDLHNGLIEHFCKIKRHFN